MKSGAKFVQKVSNLTVRSNVESLNDCSNTDGGNIEFWPGNYSAGNEQKIPGANPSKFDFGDASDQKLSSEEQTEIKSKI